MKILLLCIKYYLNTIASAPIVIQKKARKTKGTKSVVIVHEATMHPEGS